MTSSMKYINLDGLTPLQIIQKYEELLLQRENIIKQLSNQLNDSQQKYIEVSETIEQLTNKNKELNDTKLKCDKTLNQHRTDKDLLFIKLNNLISENDKLTNLIKGKKDPKSSSSPHGGNKKKEKEKDKNKDKDKNKNKIINDNKSQNIRLELKKEETTKNNISQKYEVKLKEEKIENNKSENDKSKDENKDKDKDKDNLEIKDEKKIENININNVINEENKGKNEEKKEDKKEDTKSEDKNEEKKENKNKEEKGEIKSQSEKRIIVVNPEEYLAKRRKKHKSGKKLMSEKISYDPVFK